MLSWCVWVNMDDVPVMLRSLVLVTTLLKIVFSMSCLLPLAVRVLGSRVFDVGWCVDSSFWSFSRSLFQCLQLLSWVEHNVPSGSSKKPSAGGPRNTTGRQRPGRSKIHQEIHRQIQNGWIRWLASPPLRWASGPFPGWMAATLTHLNAWTDGRTHQIPDRSGGGGFRSSFKLAQRQYQSRPHW